MPITALLFDADGRDSDLDLSGGLPQPGEQQLLWVDIQAEEGQGVPELLGHLGVDDLTRERLLRPEPQPALHQHEQHVSLTVHAIEKDTHQYRAVPVRVVAGEKCSLRTSSP